MPLVDMPIEKLLEYQGRNPKPADFDAFWDAGLAEMEATDSDVELVRHELNAPFVECFDLTFTGVGGSRVYAKYLRPRNLENPAPCVLNFHGYSGASDSNWSSYLNYVARGFCVAALDCRGQGGKSEDLGGNTGNTKDGHIIRGLHDALNGQPEKLYYRNMFLDTAQLAKIVGLFPEVDENRLGARGGSQGGALTLVCAALADIKKSAPEFPFLCDYQRVWEMDQAQAAYAELKAYFRHYDPQHLRQEAIFEALGYIDVQHLASRIKGDVIMGVGLMDTICPPSTQFAAYNRIQGDKRYVLYPDFGHEGLPGFQDIAYDFLGDL